MHAHICSDCDRLYLLSLSLSLPHSLHSPSGSLCWHLFRQAAIRGGPRFLAHEFLWSARGKEGQTNEQDNEWLFCRWTDDRLTTKCQWSGIRSDGRNAFRRRLRLRACEREREGRRSGKWKAPLEGPLESTLYTRPHVGQGFMTCHIDFVSQVARQVEKFGYRCLSLKDLPWRFVQLGESHPWTN